MNDIGAKIQSLRKQRGLTQKQLAERINKSLSAVSSYETNIQYPPLDVLISIAYALNVSVDYLAGLEYRESITLDALTDSQKKLIYMLMNEFNSPSNCRNCLSSDQMDILNQMLSIFLCGNST